VILDAANLIGPGDEQRLHAILAEALSLLGSQIVIAHAKDRAADDSVRAAGLGVLDYADYLKLLRDHAFTGPLILHGLAESEVDRAVQFLTALLQEG
jgi:sugar phosphate isomerase/epimerase